MLDMGFYLVKSQRRENRMHAVLARIELCPETFTQFGDQIQALAEVIP
jgi:hypothetical protein